MTKVPINIFVDDSLEQEKLIGAGIDDIDDTGRFISVRMREGMRKRRKREGEEGKAEKGGRGEGEGRRE